MAQLHATPQTTLRLTRAFAAPRERVFRAWTDPEELKRWFHPPGYETPSAFIAMFRRALGTSPGRYFRRRS